MIDNGHTKHRKCFWYKISAVCIFFFLYNAILIIYLHFCTFNFSFFALDTVYVIKYYLNRINVVLSKCP